MSWARKFGVSAAVLVAVVTWCVEASAETVIDQVDVSDQVWTPEGSPYLVRTVGALTVAAGRELRIEAGTEVVFPAEGALNVMGILTLAGTPAAPVVVRADADTAGVWQGIRVDGGKLVISGAVIRNAFSGVEMRGNAAQVIVRTTFEKCGTGMMLLEGDAYSFDSIVLRHNRTGISAEVSTLALTNTLIQNNDIGVLAAFLADVTVTNATVDGNGVGFLSPPSGPARHIVVQNSILSNNKTAIENDDGAVGGSSVTVSASTFWGNTTHLVHNFTGFLPPMIYAGANAPPSYDNTVADPMYVSATDLHLRPGSSCIDSGVAMNAPDHDLDQVGRPSGFSIDRGAFELGATTVTGGGGANGTGGSGANGTGGTGISIGGGGEIAGGDAGCACGVSRHAGARDGVVFGGLLLLPLARRLRRAARRG